MDTKEQDEKRKRELFSTMPAHKEAGERDFFTVTETKFINAGKPDKTQWAIKTILSKGPF